MIGGEFLYTMAQVAVAFVGFSAIVTALRQSTDELGELERGYMAALVERSLAVLGFSLLPFLLNELGFDKGKTISFSSGMLGAYMALTSVKSIAYHYSHPLIIQISSFWLRAILGLIFGVMLIANAFGFHHGYPGGIYLAGVSLLLIAAENQARDQQASAADCIASPCTHFLLRSATCCSVFTSHNPVEKCFTGCSHSMLRQFRCTCRQYRARNTGMRHTRGFFPPWCCSTRLLA